MGLTSLRKLRDDTMAEAAGKFQLIVEYSREGDEYVAKATAPGLNKEHTHKFRLTLSSTKPPWMDAKSRAPTSASVTLWSKLKSGTAKLLPAEPWSPRGSTREFEFPDEKYHTTNCMLYAN